MASDRAIETSATRLLGCDFPIFLCSRFEADRMGGADAATNAGAFGCICLADADPESWRGALRHVRSAVSGPFGLRAPKGAAPLDCVAACIEYGARAVVFGRHVSSDDIVVARSSDLAIVCEVTCTSDAVRVVSLGADILIVCTDKKVKDRPPRGLRRKLLREIRSVTDRPLFLQTDIVDGTELVFALAAGAAGIYCEVPAPTNAVAPRAATDPARGIRGSSTYSCRDEQEASDTAAVSELVAQVVRDAQIACGTLSQLMSTEARQISPSLVMLDGGLDPVHYARLRDRDLISALVRLLKLQLDGARACAVNYMAFADPADRRIIRALACEEAHWAHRLAEHIGELTSGSSLVAAEGQVERNPDHSGSPALQLQQTIAQTIEVLEMVFPLVRGTAIGNDLWCMLSDRRKLHQKYKAQFASAPKSAAADRGNCE